MTDITPRRPRGRPRTKPHPRDEVETTSLSQEASTGHDAPTPEMMIEQAFAAGIIDENEKQVWLRVIKIRARKGQPPEVTVDHFLRKHPPFAY